MGWYKNKQWRNVIHEHYDAWMLASGEVYWRCTEWQDPDYECGTRDEVLREAKEYKLLYVTYTVKEKIDKNTDLDSMPLWELAEEVNALKNGTWEVTPESLMRKLRKACGLMSQVFNKGVVSEKPEEADSNTSTATELSEEAAVDSGGGTPPPQPKHQQKNGTRGCMTKPSKGRHTIALFGSSARSRRIGPGSKLSRGFARP